MWNYYRDQQSSGIGGENNSVNYSIKDSKSFYYKTSITGKLEGTDTTKNAEIKTFKTFKQLPLMYQQCTINVPLKHLSNFWRNKNIPLINCEVEIILT